MLPFTTFSVLSLFNIQTTTLTLSRQDFGSLQTERLKTLQLEVRQVIAQTSTRYLVIDLDAVSNLGSALLTLLVDFDHLLSHQGRQLVVCGDRHGVMEALRLSHHLQVHQNRHSAIHCCTNQTIPSSQLSDRSPLLETV